MSVRIASQLFYKCKFIHSQGALYVLSREHNLITHKPFLILPLPTPCSDCNGHCFILHLCMSENDVHDHVSSLLFLAIEVLPVGCT